MSIAYVAYFVIARLLMSVTRPRPAREERPARYRYDRVNGRWVPVRQMPVPVLSPE